MDLSAKDRLGVFKIGPSRRVRVCKGASADTDKAIVWVCLYNAHMIE